jgi:hypothetical protein
VQHNPPRPWQEGAATWLSFGSGSAWTNPGGDFEGIPSSSALLAQDEPAWSTGVEWDVLGDAQAFHADGDTNSGWLLKDSSESRGTEVYVHCFASRRPASLTEEPVPILIVEYCIE